MKITVALLVAATMCSAAHAQTMYKSVMPDGRIVYGEKPAPGAKTSDPMTVPPPAGITLVTPQEKARAEQLRLKQKSAAAQPDGVAEARRQLKEAEAAREAGREPQPGERLGTLKGGSRLTDDYFTRQKAADAAVETARKRVEQLERR